MTKKNKEKVDDKAINGYCSTEEIAERITLNGLLLFQDCATQIK